MKLLLDECVVHDLKSDLVGHRAVKAGFGGLENGELLRAASGQYDVLITVDSQSTLSAKHCFIKNCSVDSSQYRNHVRGS